MNGKSRIYRMSVPAVLFVIIELLFTLKLVERAGSKAHSGSFFFISASCYFILLLLFSCFLPDFLTFSFIVFLVLRLFSLSFFLLLLLFFQLHILNSFHHVWYIQFHSLLSSPSTPKNIFCLCKFATTMHMWHPVH